MRKLSVLLCFVFAGCAFGQSYRITVETLVGNRAEDKLSFTLSAGDTQTKGFDGMLLAKRYRAKGFPHKGLEAKKALELEEAQNAEQSKLKPADVVKSLLDATSRELDAAERRIELASGRRDSIAEKMKELESLDELASRGSQGFAPAYDAFRKKYEMTEDDVKYQKLLKKRPRYTGDIEEIDYGSFCSITLVKASGKNVSIDMDYAYSRILSSFYSDGNNNSNSITKHPVVERFEKYDIKGLNLVVGKPYCIQFGRMPPEKARSLSEALAKSGIFGSGDAGSGDSGSGNSVPAREDSDLDAQGPYSEIKRKFASDGGRVVRVVISVRLEK